MAKNPSSDDDDAPLERRVADLFPSRSGTRTFAGWHSTKTVRLVATLIDHSAIVEKLAAWRAEDDSEERSDTGRRDPGFGKRGGRPAMFHDRHVLTLLLLHAVTGEPLLTTELAATARARLNPQSRELLDLPEELANADDKQTYTNLRRALRRMIDVIDSAPYSTGRRLTFKQVQEIRDMRAEETEKLAEKHRRASWLTNQLLHMTYLALPPEAREHWRGTICVDGTAVPVWGKAGSPGAKNRTPDSMCSPEFDAGWHSRTADDHNGENDKPTKRERNKHDKRFKRESDENAWAYEASIAVMSNDPDCDGSFPKLALAATLDRPGHRIAENAMVCVGAITDRGLPVNYFVGDRLYLPSSNVEKLQGPLRAIGYKVVADLKANQLGVKDQHAGALQIEGTWYCPSMPPALVEASSDHAERKISDHVYRMRIDARRDYQLQVKQKADANGVVQMRCPAMGPNPTADCPLKPQKQGSVGLGIPKLRTTIMNPPKHPDRICTNRSSTAFGPETGLKHGQAVPYRSKEWHRLYHGPRNTIEGLNGTAKDEAKSALASAGRRRARGYTLQYLYTAVLLVGTNLKMIDNFLFKKPVLTEKLIDRTDKRRRAKTLDSYRQRANAPPLVGPAADTAAH